MTDRDDQEEYEEIVYTTEITAKAAIILKQSQTIAKEDPEIQQLIVVIQKDWPQDKAQLPLAVQWYNSFRDEMAVCNG